MKNRKMKTKKKQGKGMMKSPLAREYFKKQKSLIKETLRKVANSVKRGIDRVLK